MLLSSSFKVCTLALVCSKVVERDELALLKFRP